MPGRLTLFLRRDDVDMLLYLRQHHVKALCLPAGSTKDLQRLETRLKDRAVEEKFITFVSHFGLKQPSPRLSVAVMMSIVLTDELAKKYTWSRVPTGGPAALVKAALSKDYPRVGQAILLALLHGQSTGSINKKEALNFVRRWLYAAYGRAAALAAIA